MKVKKTTNDTRKMLRFLLQLVEATHLPKHWIFSPPPQENVNKKLNFLPKVELGTKHVRILWDLSKITKISEFKLHTKAIRLFFFENEVVDVVVVTSTGRSAGGLSVSLTTTPPESW